MGLKRKTWYTFLTLETRGANTRFVSRVIFQGLGGISWRTKKRIPDNARSLFGSSGCVEQPRPALDAFPISDADALLTRYAGDKFERSQHAYRAQRAQIHIQVYALRERRDDPVPKTHTPATLYYLLLYYTNAHATLKYLDYGH